MPSIPEVDQIIDTFVTRGLDESPGCCLAVARAGEIIHSKAYGMADLGQGIKNTTNTVFFAASLSKQFTAMSILLLSDAIEEEKRVSGNRIINLDDDVRDYIHELNGLDRGKYPKITIRQLLNHTSGIRDMLIQLTLAGWRWGNDDITRDHVLWLISRMKTLNFEPGSRFAYSNTNYFLAGEVVARVSEKSLAKFARDHIFVPLGMQNTRFVDTHRETVENRASGYRRLKAGQGFENRMPNYDLTGPTNAFTTVGDLLRWHANFDPDDSNMFGEVGGKRGVAALQRPTVTSDGYGLGMYVLLSNGVPEKIFHDGRTIGHRAHLLRDHLQKISIALLCNVEFSYFKATHDLVYAIAEVVRGSNPTRITIDEPEDQLPRSTTPPATLEKYRGTYYNGEIDTTYEVTRDGSELMVTRPHHEDCALTNLPGYPNDTFFARSFTDVLREVELTFLRNGSADIKGFELDWSSRIGLSRLVDFRFDKQ